MPTAVVAANLPGRYVWTRFTFQLSLRLSPLVSSDVPGSPSSGSNCSSGGNTSVFFCPNQSTPPWASRRRLCRSVDTTSSVPRTPLRTRHTSSVFVIRAAVWSGLL